MIKLLQRLRNWVAGPDGWLISSNPKVNEWCASIDDSLDRGEDWVAWLARQEKRQ